MNNPQIKKQYNASITVTCICWLQANKDTFKKDTWKQALHRFNSENNAQISALTFHTAAKQLGIEFKASGRTSQRGTNSSNTTSSSVLIGKLIRMLITDIEKAVGGPVASPRVLTLLTAFIGKKSIAELEELFNDQ